jgi:hypothetical protein
MVPACLPTRSVDVSVQLGGETSTSLPLSVTAAAGVLNLALGADTTLSAQDVPPCLRVDSGGPQEFLAVVQSAGTIGAARFDYTFTGLRPVGPKRARRGLVADPVTGRVAGPRSARGRRGDTTTFGTGVFDTAQAEWDLFLREREDILRAAASPGRRTNRRAPRTVPVVGDLSDFDVLRADGDFDRVTARVRMISERAILYEDTIAAFGRSQSDVKLVTGLFDDPIYPVDTRAFGSPSDLDGNGRAIILFTPSVNRLSPPGSSDFIGGFFFGLDLMPELEHSNGGEVFYVLVPDPTGAFGNVRDAEMVRSTVPPVLAHEFQHMIHHNERIIQRGTANREALWRSEGLAHIAEDLVGEELRRRERVAEAGDYQSGNRRRASLFLTEPSEVSLIIGAGQGRAAWRSVVPRGSSSNISGDRPGPTGCWVF